MDLKEFLYDSKMSFAERMERAKVSTLGSETLIITWLQTLIRSKLEDITNENVAEEQVQVWALLSSILSSAEVKILATQNWNCPITSKFVVTMVDTLEGTKAQSPLQTNIINAFYALLQIPQISTIITLNTQLCFSACTILLDIVSLHNWSETQDLLNQSLDNEITVKRSKLENGVSVNCNSDVNEDRDNLLKILSILLENSVLRFEALKTNSEFALYIHKFFLKMVNARVALESYTGDTKSKLFASINSSVTILFFNSVVMDSYEKFLNLLMFEDCKLEHIKNQSIFGDHAIKIATEILSDIAAYEGNEAVLKTSFDLFFRMFLKKCSCVESKLNMMIYLFHLSGIKVPGHFISEECLDFGKFELKDVYPIHSELLSCTLIEVFKESVSSEMNHFEPFLFALLEKLLSKKTHTKDGFLAIRSISGMFPLKLSDNLPDLLGLLAVSKKENSEIEVIYGSVLINILKPHTKMLRVESFVMTLMEGVLTHRSELQSPDQIMLPLFGERTDENQSRHLLLPTNFVQELQRSVAVTEPLLLCRLLESVTNFWKEKVLPLVKVDNCSVPKEQDALAVTALALITSKLISRTLPRRTLHTYGVCKKLAETLTELFSAVLRPLLGVVLDSEASAGLVVGVIVLWRSALHMLRNLTSKQDFLSDWMSLWVGFPEDISKLLPLVSNSALSALENKLSEKVEENSKMQFILLCEQCLSYITVDDLFASKALNISDKGTAGLVIPNPANAEKILTSIMKMMVRWRSSTTQGITLETMCRLITPDALRKSNLARLVVEDCLKDGKVGCETRSSLHCNELVKMFSPQLAVIALKKIISSVEYVKMQKKSTKRKSIGDNVVNAEETPFSSYMNGLVPLLELTGKFNSDKQAKKSYKESSKAMCEKFTSLINGLDGKIAKYSNDFIGSDQCKRLLLLLQNLPFDSLSDSLRTSCLLVLFAIYFHSNLNKAEDESVVIIFSILDKCFKSQDDLRFSFCCDLPVVERLVFVYSKLDTDLYSDDSVLTPASQVRRLLKHTIHKLLKENPNADQSILDCCSVFTKSDTEKVESYLNPAWVIVRECFDCVTDNNTPESRKKSCRKVVRNIGNWCIKIVRNLDDNFEKEDAIQMMKIYSILLRMEKVNQNKKDLDLNKSGLNMSIMSDVSEKVPKWRKYLDDGVKLARKCLESRSPRMVYPALSFIISIKFLVTDSLEEVIPKDVQLESLKALSEVPSGTRTADLNNLVLESHFIDDPVTGHELSFSRLFGDLSLEDYQEFLNKLMEQEIDLHTVTVWQNILKTDVPQEHSKVKRTCINLLTRNISWKLSKCGLKNGGTSTQLDGPPMVLMTRLINSVVHSNENIFPQTVVQCFMVASTSTKHLSLDHFVKVWPEQMMLLEQCLLRRHRVMEEFFSASMSAFTALIEELVWRSVQHTSPIEQETLSRCTIHLEKLMTFMSQVEKSLGKFGHFAIARIICCLHLHKITGPVKTVLEHTVYKLLSYCDSNASEHLPAAVPPKIRGTLRYYQENFASHYTKRLANTKSRKGE